MKAIIPSNQSSAKGKSSTIIKLQDDCDIKVQDVLLGRGKCNFKHEGNVAYRILIETRLEKYVASDSRSEKTHMVVQVVETISEAGGRFLKQEGSADSWYAVDKKTAREKVGHSFRDAIKAKNGAVIRVEEKLDPSISVKSSFADILRYLTREHSSQQSSIKVGATNIKDLSNTPDASPARKRGRPTTTASYPAQSDSIISPARARLQPKRKLPPASSLEQISKRAAETYMNLSEDARINVARRAVASAEGVPHISVATMRDPMSMVQGFASSTEPLLNIRASEVSEDTHEERISLRGRRDNEL